VTADEILSEIPSFEFALSARFVSKSIVFPAAFVVSPNSFSYKGGSRVYLH
jgi:hypothetical protein